MLYQLLIILDVIIGTQDLQPDVYDITMLTEATGKVIDRLIV